MTNAQGQEFTPPTDGAGIPLSNEEKRRAIEANPIAVSEADREEYLATYVPASQALRDGTPELVGAIGTGTAEQLDKFHKAHKPKWWHTGLKITGYVFGTLGMHWALTKLSNRTKGNSVKK